MHSELIRTITVGDFWLAVTIGKRYAMMRSLDATIFVCCGVETSK